ncbi:hypothetical protein IFHNHDMJ_02188 [Synechococcus sp. CBW1107]|nr:hypothetical protein IFHNHDMJ_02188 [Synechococcus sp. CBW1107]
MSSMDLTDSQGQADRRADQLRRKGKDLLVQGQSEPAFACFDEAFALAPERLIHRLNAAAVHRARGRAEAVLPLLRPLAPRFRSSLQPAGSDPSGDPSGDPALLPVFWRHLADAESQAGEPCDAARCWLELVRLEPSAERIEDVLQALGGWLDQRRHHRQWGDAADLLLNGLRDLQPHQPWIQGLQPDSPLLRLRIRPERHGEAPLIHALHRQGFPDGRDARQVDVLRAAGQLSLSLVAELEGELVGHVAFSPASLLPPAPGVPDPCGIQGLALAPLSVMEPLRRQGIASRLVAAGLAAARDRGWAWVVLIGGLHFYGRFGFGPASAFGLRDAYGFGEECLAMELQPGSLPPGGGLVRYSPLLGL